MSAAGAMDTTHREEIAVPATKSTQRRPARSRGGKLPAFALAQLITDTVLFAGRDDTLPMLNGIHLESTSGQLLAAATDRFTLGVAMVPYPDGGGHEFETTLKLQQVQILARIAKACKQGEVTIASTAAGTSFTFSTGEALVLPGVVDNNRVDVEFPAWRQIVAGSTRESGGVETMSFDPALMARFAKVSHARKMSIKFTEPNKPALIAIGNSFIGLVMPQRVEAGREPVWSPEWLNLPEQKAVTAPAEKPAAKKAPAKRAAKKAS